MLNGLLIYSGKYIRKLSYGLDQVNHANGGLDGMDKLLRI